MIHERHLDLSKTMALPCTCALWIVPLTLLITWNTVDQSDAQTTQTTTAGCDLRDCASVPPPSVGDAIRWYKCNDNPQLCLPDNCRCDGRAHCMAGGAS